MRQDDGHDAVLLEVLETVQQEGKVGGGFGRQAVVLEAHALTQRVGGLPAVAEWRVGYHRIEARHLGPVRLAHHVSFIGQLVAVEDLELRLLHPVQQHVHARQVVGGDVLFLS